MAERHSFDFYEQLGKAFQQALAGIEAAKAAARQAGLTEADPQMQPLTRAYVAVHNARSGFDRQFRKDFPEEADLPPGRWPAPLYPQTWPAPEAESVFPAFVDN